MNRFLSSHKIDRYIGGATSEFSQKRTPRLRQANLISSSILARTASPLSIERQVMMTLAPIRARWKAVLFPMPGGETRKIDGERRYVECATRVAR